jgi:membrane-associated phospholipid phosphatase
MLHGFADTPRNAIRPKNLAWELPVAAATGLLIAYGDRPAENRFKSPTLQQDSDRASNIGIGLELGAGGIAWISGCAKDNPTLANNAFVALAAGGFGQVINLGIKEGFRRQYPYQPNSTGAFFSRSRAGSFTSGHATTSFAFAAAIAHRYPHKPWVVWGSYGLATGLSLARLPAHKHYPSDILVGAAIGYATGTYIANHATP